MTDESILPPPSFDAAKESMRESNIFGIVSDFENNNLDGVRGRLRTLPPGELAYAVARATIALMYAKTSFAAFLRKEI